MKYTKPPLTWEQQADLLLGRGLIADKDVLVQRLQATSYFRLSGYLYPFRKPDSEQFIEGTSLEQVWRLCVFDQRLRTHLLDAIEAIEVFVRTQLAYHFATVHGAFSYDDNATLPHLSADDFAQWQKKLKSQTQRSLKSKEEFLVHFFKRYGKEHTHPPIWTAIELMDFGSTLTFYSGSDYRVKQTLARTVSIPDKVFSSWLLGLHTVRNRCAHHLRLWNWTSGTPVLLPNQKKYPDWHSPTLDNDRIGIVLTLCRHLLNQISPNNQWSARLINHFDEFPEVPVGELGFPEEWREHPLWKQEPSTDS